MIWKRERDAEQEDLRNMIKNRCFKTYDFETYESIRIVRRQNCDSYMNIFSSSLKQHSMASPPSLRVPGGGVYLSLWCFGPGTEGNSL